MITASIVEMLTLPPAGVGPTAVVQTSDQPTQTFGESLRAAAKVFSGTDSANDGSSKTARRQKSASADANAVPAAPSPKQLVVGQQSSWINPIIIPTQLPLGVAIASLDVRTVAASQTTGDAAAVAFSEIESKSAQPGVVQSEIDLLPTSRLSGAKTQSTKASVVPVSQAADNLSHASASTVPASHDDAVASALQNATNLQSAVTNVVVPDLFSSAVPNAGANVAADTDPSAVPSAGHSSVVNKGQDWIQNVVLNGIPNVLLSADPVAVLHAAANPSADIVADPSANLVANVSAGLVANAVPNAFPGAVHAAVAKALQNPLPNAVLNVIANSAGPVALMHAAVSASAKQNVAPAATPISTGQVIPPVSAPDQSVFVTGLSVPAATANQLVALVQPGGELLVTVATGISNPGSAATAKLSATDATNTKDAIRDTTNNATGLNPAPPSASGQAGSQGTPQSGDQSQGENSAQGQNAAPVQMNFASHPGVAIDHTQSAGIISPLQTAPTLAGSAGHSAKTPDAAPTVATVVPQPLPVINTAKLIQTMGQSEMRVGMRSNEFGNISINTSVSRDLISAQISLDHGDLARTLAAHLPEMQATLGNNQALDVRIDINGQGAGQGQGTSAGMSNGSGDGSRDDRQLRGSEPTTRSIEGLAEGQLSSAASTVTTVDRVRDARLDIRV